MTLGNTKLKIEVAFSSQFSDQDTKATLGMQRSEDRQRYFISRGGERRESGGERRQGTVPGGSGVLGVGGEWHKQTWSISVRSAR